MTHYAIIENAIRDLAVVCILYGGSERIIEPHLLGRNTKGNVCLSAFQVSGGSGFSFRAFLMEKIESAELTGDHFDGPREGYNPNDHTMIEIFARI